MEPTLNSNFQPGAMSLTSDSGLPSLASMRMSAAWAEFEHEIFAAVGQALDRMLEDSQFGVVAHVTLAGSGSGAQSIFD